jgi:hypothetical protein
MLNDGNDSSASSDGSTNVRVAIRMRPLNSRELDLQSHKCIQMIGGTEVVVSDPEAMQEHRFNFDFCFDTTAPDSDPSAGKGSILSLPLASSLLHSLIPSLPALPCPPCSRSLFHSLPTWSSLTLFLSL